MCQRDWLAENDPPEHPDQLPPEDWDQPIVTDADAQRFDETGELPPVPW
jgi:hypothetical protein